MNLINDSLDILIPEKNLNYNFNLQNSSTCHNLISNNSLLFDDEFTSKQLFKNKSESDLQIRKKLNKIYLPAEDWCNMEQSYKESTGKKYSSSWFYGDSSKNPYPTIEEQVKLCRKIASQLVDDENRKSKGATMFFKRVKKAQKWIHEGQDTKEKSINSSNSSIIADEEVEKLKRNLKMEPLPKLKLLLDPREILSLEKLKKTSDIVEHNIVSPDVCHNLVKDLNSPEINKGAAIFLKRKEKSRDWIVDETSTSVQIREQKREQELRKQEENIQQEWLIKKHKDTEIKQQTQVETNKVKTLSDECQKSILNLNNNLEINQLEQHVPKFNLSSLSPNLFHNNYKSFNRNARGWGVSNEDYVKQINELQKPIEFKRDLNLQTKESFKENLNKIPNEKLNEDLNKKHKQTLYNSSNKNYFSPNNYKLLNKQTTFNQFDDLAKLSSKSCSLNQNTTIHNKNNYSNISKIKSKDTFKQGLDENKFIFNQNHVVTQNEHFSLNNLQTSTLKIPKYRNFNTTPKLWTRNTIAF